MGGKTDGLQFIKDTEAANAEASGREINSPFGVMALERDRKDLDNLVETLKK